MSDVPADERTPFSGLLFVAQMIAVPILSIPLGTLLVEILEFETGTRGANWLIPLVCYAAVGFAEGYFTEKISGSADSSGGRFVWAPLLCLIAIGVLRDRLGAGSAIRELLTWSPHSINGGASELLTMPAWACCCYSLGVFVANRRAGRAAQAAHSSD